MKIQLSIFLVTINLVFFSVLSAQDMTDIDSIEAKLLAFQKAGKIDSASFIAFKDIFEKYSYSDFSKAEKIGKLVIETGEKLNKYFLLDFWYGQMGQFYSSYKIYSFALDYYKKGWKNSQKMGISGNWWAINIGNVYYAQKNYNKAALYYRQAIGAFSEEIKPDYDDPLRGIAVAYANLGLIYENQQQIDSALVMLHKSYAFRKKYDDPFDITFICTEIVNLHIKMKNYDSAFFYVDKALFYDKKIQPIYRKVTVDIYNQKAEIFLKQSNYSKALELLDSAIQISILQNNTNSRLQSYIKVIDIQNNLKIYSKAIDNGKVALQLAGQTGNNRKKADILKTLSDLYSKVKDFRPAYKYQLAYVRLKDSIAEKKLNVLLYKFEAEQSKQKASFLENELILSNKERTTYKYLVWAGASLTFVLLMFFFVIIRSSRALKKMNSKIDNQNKRIIAQFEEIEQQNEEITVHNEMLNDKNEQLTEVLNKLKETQAQLIQKEKMASLGILTAGIAHEINNPINFISTGINSLQKDFNDMQIIISEVRKLKPDDGNIREKLINIKKLGKEYYFKDACEAIPQTIKDITKGIDRTVEIVNGLKVFSRMEDESFKLFDIHETIDNALLILRNKYKNRILVHRDFTNDIHRINCNPGKLIQVFMNIVDNAIDAIDEKDGKGEIWISTKNSGNNIVVSIKDSGRGMDKENIERIFDPFFTTKEVGKGIGLGMAITYGIIKEHNAEIDFSTEIGKGTEFIITFPINE